MKYGTIRFFISVFLILNYSVDFNSQTIEEFLERASQHERNGKVDLTFQTVDSALILATRNNDQIGLIQVFAQMGVHHQMRGDYNNALTYQLKALKICEQEKNPKLNAEVLNNIGSIHHYQNNYAKAKEYYEKCLAIRIKLNDKRSLALSYNNFGALYEDMGKLDDALEQHYNSLNIWKELENKGWQAISYANIGTCFVQLEKLDSALFLYQKSLGLIQYKEGTHQIGWIMNKIGNVYVLKNQAKKGVEHCSKALENGEQWNALPVVKDACECLYKAYESLGKPKLSLDMYKQYISLRDSLSGNELTRELTKLDLDYNFKKEQFADSLKNAEAKLKAQYAFDTELNQEKSRRNIFLIIGIGILLLAALLWNRLQFMRKSRAQIQIERDRSDELLLNILPESVAEELKETGEAQAKDFQDITVLFTDFEGFTEISERLKAKELVEELNICFKAFDRIIEKYNLEKIKTIGDAYMAAGGFNLQENNAFEVVLAALELQEFMLNRKTELNNQGEQTFNMRLGIHTGPVVAGVVGVKKFQYDIWGDTVNIAARMEQNGQIGKVNISNYTFDLIKNKSNLKFSSRGKIIAKGKGEIEMYFVESNLN